MSFLQSIGLHITQYFRISTVEVEPNDIV